MEDKAFSIQGMTSSNSASVKEKAIAWARLVDELGPFIYDMIDSYLDEGKKILAIKLYWALHPELDLRGAKDAIEAYQKYKGLPINQVPNDLRARLELNG